MKGCKDFEGVKLRDETTLWSKWPSFCGVLGDGIGIEAVCDAIDEGKSGEDASMTRKSGAWEGSWVDSAQLNRRGP